MAGRKSKRGRYARSAAPRNTAINIRSTSNAVDEAQVSKQPVTGTSNQKHSNLRPRQNPTNATPQNTTITVPSTSTAVDEAQVPTERPAGTTNQEGLNLRRGRSRSKKPVQESKTSLAPSPKRVGSRVGDPSKVFEDLLMIRKGDAGHAAEVAQAAARAVKVVPPLDAVVKVFSARAEPNFLLPWQTKQTSVITSGFIIKERKVLTQAYYVENHTRVMIKKRGSDTKYLASVLAVGSECDIAILTVSDDEFWEGVSPVEFGDLPALETPVTVVGYPEGGHTISVCNAVVSRGDFLPVGWSTELFVLQIDAPIESGFAGAPAFSDDGKCVGIAIESYKVTHGEKIGYLVSAPIITHFIQDFDKNGAYTGFPELGIDWQDMENPDLRKLMGMEPNQTGVRIRRVEPTAPESQVLKPSDVILSFDGVNIANDGSVPTRPGVHMHFSYLVSQKYIGDNAVVKILRNSDTLEFNIKLGTRKRLIPDHFRGNSLPYYIIAGFVFMVVSGRYLRSQYGNRFEFESPVRLLDKLLETMAESEDEQIVVVSQVLLADINIGYEGIVNKQVIAFNGKRVKNLKHLAGMVESCNEEFLKFVLEYNQIVVLQTKRAKEATADILRRHTIPSAMSDDLKTSDEIGEGSKKT